MKRKTKVQGNQKVAFAAAMALSLLLAACGGGADDAAPTPAPAAPTAVAPSGPSPQADIDYGVYTPDCDDAIEVQGFLTCADVDAARAEGELVLYAPSFEPAQIAILEAFGALFPEIGTKNLRLQTGALYSRTLQERAAGVYAVDVMVLSDMSMLREMQASGAFESYVSPEIYDFPFPEHLSEPAGFFTSWGTLSAGIAYSPGCLSEADAPKTWEDLLDPKFKGRVNFKNANSGLQMLQWSILKDTLGVEYWDRMVEQETTHFDSMVQQYERIVSCEDLVSGLAQYSGYLQAKSDGADLVFVIPEVGGLPAGPESFGLVTPRPNQEAGKLFVDFLHSAQGQSIVQRRLNYHSVRGSLGPPEGGVSTADANFQVPGDWEAYAASRPEFEAAWSRITGQ